MIIKLRRKVLKAAFPLMAWWGDLHFPFSRKALKAKDYWTIKSLAMEGCVLLSYTKGEFTNLTIPGELKHTGILTSRGVVEAKGHGVLLTDLIDFVIKADRIVILSPNLGMGEMRAAAKYALTLVGKPYDFMFEIPDRNSEETNPSFYCSEIPHWCYLKVSNEYKFKLREIWGVKTIQPDDYLNADKHFDEIWDTDEG